MTRLGCANRRWLVARWRPTRLYRQSPEGGQAASGTRRINRQTGRCGKSLRPFAHLTSRNSSDFVSTFLPPYTRAMFERHLPRSSTTRNAIPPCFRGDEMNSA